MKPKETIEIKEVEERLYTQRDWDKQVSDSQEEITALHTKYTDEMTKTVTRLTATAKRTTRSAVDKETSRMRAALRREANYEMIKYTSERLRQISHTLGNVRI